MVRKISSAVIALLLMLTTMGVSINKHYCMGEVRHVALFHAAPSCQNEMDMTGEQDCCQDTTQEFQLDEYSKITYGLNFNFEDLSLEMAVSDPVTLARVAIASGDNAFRNYKPPLIGTDIPVLIQSFLL